MLPSISGRARPSVGIARIVPILFGYGLLVTIKSSKHSNLHMQKKKRKRTIGEKIGKAVNSVENDRTCNKLASNSRLNLNPPDWKFHVSYRQRRKVPSA